MLQVRHPSLDEPLSGLWRCSLVSHAVWMVGRGGCRLRHLHRCLKLESPCQVGMKPLPQPEALRQSRSFGLADLAVILGEDETGIGAGSSCSGRGARDVSSHPHQP